MHENLEDEDDEEEEEEADDTGRGGKSVAHAAGDDDASTRFPRTGTSSSATKGELRAAIVAGRLLRFRGLAAVVEALYEDAPPRRNRGGDYGDGDDTGSRSGSASGVSGSGSGSGSSDTTAADMAADKTHTAACTAAAAQQQQKRIPRAVAPGDDFLFELD